jgi:hypothetical protein
VSGDEDLTYDFPSFDEGSEEMLGASEHLSGAAGESAGIQGRAGAQLRQWLPTAGAADTIDDVEATADQALSQATDITGEDAGKLLTQKQTMLDTEHDLTARIKGIGSDPTLPETGDAEQTPDLVDDGLSAEQPALTFGDDGNPLPPSRIGSTPDSNGRYPEPEGPEWEDVRNAALDQANDMPRPPGVGDPKMAGALRMPDGKIYTGSSGQDIDFDSYPKLKSVIDSIPADNQSRFNWHCAEVDNITQALDDGYKLKDLAGAQSSAAQIRGLSSAVHGAWREPCDGDKYLLGLLKMDW